MKTIYFVRHAKSSWDDMSLSDHDRPLNNRGRKDAPRMANRLLGMDVVPDGILTSSAKRAQQTARAFREGLGVSKDSVIVRKELYHAWPDMIERQVRQLPENWNTVLVFGHNPGFTELANQLQNEQYIGNVPTCGITLAHAEIDHWRDFVVARAKRVAYFYPKQVT